MKIDFLFTVLYFYFIFYSIFDFPLIGTCYMLITSLKPLWQHCDKFLGFFHLFLRLSLKLITVLALVSFLLSSKWIVLIFESPNYSVLIFLLSVCVAFLSLGSRLHTHNTARILGTSTLVLNITSERNKRWQLTVNGPAMYAWHLRFSPLSTWCVIYMCVVLQNHTRLAGIMEYSISLST